MQENPGWAIFPPRPATTTMNEKHEQHQSMLREHAARKIEARERHRKGWHKRKIAPYQYI